MADVLALYRPLPLRVRLHTAIRDWTAPLTAVAQRLGSAGRVLEVGCGHGLVSNAAALGSPDLHVLGVDPSAEKITAAQATVGTRGNISFRCESLSDVGDSGFTAIAVVDVLYLVPRTGWVEFLAGCRDRLASAGRLVLKEVDTRPAWKFHRCVAQETLSVRLLGLTLGGGFAFADQDSMRSVLEAAGFAEVRVTRLDGGYLTPHVLYEARRA